MFFFGLKGDILISIRSNFRDRKTGQSAVNHNIRAKEVRLIGVDGEQVGIVPLVEALAMAEREGLDLIEINASSQPPVCKILDYGKYQYELKKQRATAKKNQIQIQVKEVKFRPGTEEGDYQVKLRNLIRFLSEGNKAKVSLRFKGREMAHQELGMELLERVRRDLDEYAQTEHMPKMEGRQLVMVLAPKKKK